MSPTVAVEPWSSLTDEDWARVSVGTDIYGTRSWILAGEPHRSFEPSPLVARDGEGRVCGLLPAWWYNGEGSPTYDYARLFGHGTVANLHNEPVLVLGSRAGYSSSVLAPDPAVREALVLAADVLGRERAGWALLYGHRRTAALLVDALGDATPEPLLCGAETVIDADGGLPGYISRLPSKRRRAVRREIRTFAEAGLTVHREDPAHAPEHAALLVQNQERYGHNGDVGRATNYLTGQVDLLGEQAVLWTCRVGGQDGTVVGFLYALRHDDVLYVRAIGFDYARLGDSFAYFNLGFYTPLSAAPELGVRELRLGVGGYQAKVRRGAHLDPRFGWVRLTDRDADLAWREHALQWSAGAAGEIFPGLEPADLRGLDAPGRVGTL